MKISKTELLKLLDGFWGPLLVALLPVPKKVFPGNVEKILVIRPGGIGDAVLLVPALVVLKSRYPSAVIDVLAENRNVQVFELCPDLRELYRYDKITDLIKVLVRKYDVIVDTEQWHRFSSVVTRIVRSEVKIGFSTNERRRLYTDTVGYSHDDYEVDSFFHLMGPLGGAVGQALPPPFLEIPESKKWEAEHLSKLQRPYVVIFPGSSIEERKWDAQCFAELARRIDVEGCEVVIIGGTCDFEVSMGIEANANNVINMAGRTSLLESAGILADAAALVSGDSGILHLAVGLGVPTVSLFGPGIAEKWAPRGDGHIVINHDLDCSPCTKFGYTPRCETGAPCIANISVDEVFSAVKALLSRLRKES